MDTIQKTVIRILLVIFITVLIEFLVPSYGLSAEKRFQNSLGMEFVLIPAGSFEMGSPPDESHRNKDERKHRVTISKAFYMQTTEVTRGQWRSLMARKLFSCSRGPGNRPKVKVSWFDCISFVEKLNDLKEGVYHLPTEAEWEYACRAGSSDAYSCGKDIECAKAMYSNNELKSGDCIDYFKSKGLSAGGPAPVKSFPPNAWGIYDMHGNVWEWCQDWYGRYPQNAVTDPKGPDSGTMRVRRGGSWFKYGWLCRSANRNQGHPASKYDTLGFRVIREVP